MAIGNPFNDGLVAFPDEHEAFRMSDPGRFVNAIGQLCQFQPGRLHLDRQDSKVHSGTAAMNVQ